MLFSFKEDINFLKAIGLSYRVEQGNDLLDAMGIGRIIPDKPHGGIMKDDYKYELDEVLDDYAIRLYKSYHQIDAILNKMDEFLMKAGNFPEDLKSEDAGEVQEFLSEMDKVMRDYEYLFDRFDE